MLLAFGGIVSALILISLWASSVMSFNTLAFLSLTSFLMGVIFIEGRLKTSFICYGAVSLLSLILPIDKTNALAFILFFGYYPIVKSYIERINNFCIELILKIILFLTVSFGSVYGYFMLFSVNISEILPLWAVSLAATVFFVIFDYVLSMLFGYYVKKIRMRIKR